MKKTRLIISLVSIFFILISLVLLEVTYGWLASIIDYPNGVISVGDLRYSETGEFITDGSLIIPGEELLDTDITVTDSSPIDSQLRVKIDYTKITRPVDVLVTSTVAYSDALDDHLDVTMNGLFTYSSDYWYYNGTSGVITAESGLISIITSISYDGDETGNDYSTQTVGITVTIQVKQADNVTWSELATYDFSTGYPE